MRRLVEGTDRGQSTLFPECLEDWIDENNPVRVIDVFVEELDLGELGFGGVDPEATGRPSYHPSVLDDAGLGSGAVRFHILIVGSRTPAVTSHRASRLNTGVARIPPG